MKARKRRTEARQAKKRNRGRKVRIELKISQKRVKQKGELEKKKWLKKRVSVYSLCFSLQEFSGWSVPLVQYN